MNYSEDPETIKLFPLELYDEDLTLDCGVEIDAICTKIHEACKGWGILNFKRLGKALYNTTGNDRKKIALRYPEMYDTDLRKFMRDKLRNSDFGLLMQFLADGPVEVECMMLKHAMDGFGSDKVMLYTILCGRSNDDMTLLKKTYCKMYYGDLTAEVSRKSGGDIKAILTAAMQAAEEEFNPDYHTEDKAAVDAEAFYKLGQARRWGTDEEVS